MWVHLQSGCCDVDLHIHKWRVESIYITFTHRIIYSDMPKSKARSLPAYCPRMRVLLFIRNRTVQREAVSRACGKRGVLCTVYVSSPLHWPTGL